MDVERTDTNSPSPETGTISSAEKVIVDIINTLRSTGTMMGPHEAIWKIVDETGVTIEAARAALLDAVEDGRLSLTSSYQFILPS